MKIAFYAPMKPPDDPKPSGDRQMARLLIRALETAGHEVIIAARLKSRVADGAEDAQMAVEARAARARAALLEEYSQNPAARPDLWFSYHVYYKAPDWIGPEISQALDIPYVIYEASHAPKRRDGPWARSFRQAEQAITQAAQILSPNSANDPCVRAIRGNPDGIVAFPPFLDCAAFQYQRPVDDTAGAIPEIITAAMMRPGAKRDSYAVLANALAECADLPWTLRIIGDGPMRPDITEYFAPLGGRVSFSGEVAAAAMPEELAKGDVFAWPAVNEAYGMALLEAQAAGLPVIAGREGGVAGIIRDGETGLLTEPRDAGAFARALRRLLTAPKKRRSMGLAGGKNVFENHSLPAAARRLDQILAASVRSRAA